MIRFGGLATGQDTQAIVDTMLEVERIPIYRLENEIVEEEEKYSAWSDLDTKTSDLSSKLTKLTSYLTWRQNDVSSTKESVATASAGTNAAFASYNVNVSQLAQAHMVGSDSQTDTTSALNQSGTFSLNGSGVITIELTDTLEDIRDKINDETFTDSGITATIINTTLVLERDDTGETEITVDTDSGILDALGIRDTGAWKNTLQHDQKLNATINGVDIDSNTNDNITSVLQGVTLNFKGEGTTTLDVTRDIETIKSAFEEFVDSYNALMELAEDQTRVSLSGSGDSVQDLGALQGESAVSTLRFSSRSMVTANKVDPEISNGFNNLQDIGIWTDGDQNRISVVSDSRLNDALENNFDDVEDMIRDFDTGILKLMDKYISQVDSPVDGTIARKQTSIRNHIQENEKKIDDLNYEIEQKETELFEHFAVMESAVASIKQQGSFLSQLG